MKIKLKSYGDKVTDCYNKEIPKVDSNRTSLPVIILDSAINKDENYSQVFLKECKYIREKVIEHIMDDLESFSDNSDEEWNNAIWQFCERILEGAILKMYIFMEKT